MRQLHVSQLLHGLCPPDENLDKIAKKIINGLDKVEVTFGGKDIVFLSVDIDEVPDLEIASVPSLVYFKNGEPEVYDGILMIIIITILCISIIIIILIMIMTRSTKTT